MSDGLDLRMDLDPAILAEHLRDLRALAQHLTRSPHEAEDLVQETLVAAMDALGDLRDPELAGAWLLRILRRKWTDLLRRRFRERQARKVQAPPDLAVRSEAPAEDVVQRALRSLSPDDARLLRLRYFEKRTSSEIGVLLGKPAGTVRSMIFQLLRRLETLCRRIHREEDL
jgi:RNA polymerase sigma factor (sigma-70 family)